MIEYNIVNIIAGNKFLKDLDLQKAMTFEEYELRAVKSNKILHNLSDGKTMGQVVSAAKCANLFSDYLASEIDRIKARRDYYAHTFYKEILFTNDFEANPSKLIKQLDKDISDFCAVNEKLLAIDRGQRKLANEAKNKILS